MSSEQTYEQWSAEDFILSEIDRTPDQNEKLVRMWEYLSSLGGYDDVIIEDNE